MARGRKGQPAEVRAAKGNPGKRKDTTVPVAELPTLSRGAPKHLSVAAKKVWDTIVPKMQHARLLRETDTGVVERYCETVADYWDATRQLRDGKKVKKSVYEAETTNGGTLLRINPWFAVQERLSNRLEKMEDRMGLSPRSRQEVLYRMALQPSAPPGDLFADNASSDDKAGQPKSASSPVGFLNAPPAGNA